MTYVTEIPDNLLDAFEQDETFRGNPWRFVVVDRVRREEQFLYRGDSHGAGTWGEIKRAPTTRRGYIRVRESLIDDNNLAIVSRAEAGVMFLARGAEPEFLRPSRSNPAELMAYFRWLPSVVKFDRSLIGHHEVNLTPEQEQELAERRKRLEGKRELGNVSAGIKYVCTCGKRHVRVVHFDDPDPPPTVCPGGKPLQVEESSYAVPS